MIGDHDDPVEVDTIDEDLDHEDPTADLAIQTANVGETSVEIDVEALIAEFEAESEVASNIHEADPRKRLEKILEERRAARELDDIDEFALDTSD
jgi:type II secretory pathway component PulK